MRVHLMGAGGAGVSALARVFLARGDDVTGCDLKESETTAELEEAGVRMSVGHDPEHVLGQDLLVYSGAIKKSPELDAARAMGVKVLSRAEMLAQMINDADSIAVAGTAGKTTVTHMVGHILVIAGYDPTVLVGDGSSARAGKTEWLVAETDESDGTLTLHHPQRAIVTNIELDHPDHFRDVSAVRDLFQWFVEGLPESGLALLCADDDLARELKPRARKVTYGFRHDATYRCEPVRRFQRRRRSAADLSRRAPAHGVPGGFSGRGGVRRLRAPSNEGSRDDRGGARAAPPPPRRGLPAASVLPLERADARLRARVPRRGPGIRARRLQCRGGQRLRRSRVRPRASNSAWHPRRRFHQGEGSAGGDRRPR